jgi:uncharacterized protein (TIGR03437 family)
MRVFLFLAVSALAFAQGSTYRWLKEIGGSASDVAIGMAMDRDGNTYIAGNTISLDFPVANALQPLPAASALYRVDAGSATATALRSARVLSVWAVAIDPRDSRIFYAITDSKVLRSGDAGATWTGFVAPRNQNSAYSIDVASDGTVYITADDVIYTSADLTNWKPISAGVTKGRIYAVTVDPSNPSRLFARTSDGLAWSEDAGATWTQTGVYVFDVSFDPFTPGTMYAGGVTALVSHDSGKTWTSLGAFPVRDVVPQTVLRDPLHPDLLYAANYNGIFISIDSGQTWQQSTHSAAYPLVVDRVTGLIYAISGPRIVTTQDGFNSTTQLGPAAFASLRSFRAAGGSLLIGAFATNDVFVTKLDPDGNIVYSTYFGGTTNDLATAMNVDTSGAVYVAGTTSSLDFPVTPGAYQTKPPNQSATFLFKLKPDGTLAYSTYFPSGSPAAVAVDSAGSAYIAGTTSGGLPTTPGAYQTEFNGTFIFCGVGAIFCPPNFVSNAFVTKFSPNGSGLIYSTYLGKQTDTGTALALAPDGSAYVGGPQHIFKLSADGSSLLATTAPTFQPAQFVSDANGNLYAAGRALRTQAQAGVVHSFVNAVAAPGLPGGNGYSGNVAIVAKFAPDLSPISAALVGGERDNSAASVSLDSSGNVLLAGSTTSHMFPTRAPLQSQFASQTGFVAQLSADLATLSFASYEGDTRPFSILNAMTAKDGSLVFGGSPLQYYSIPFDGPYQPQSGPAQPPHVFVARLDLSVPSPRLDSVANAASFASVPLTANEAIVLTGDGFGADAQVLVDGQPVTVLSSSAKSITAVLPADFKSDGASQVAVSSGGTLTNSILAPDKPGAPGIFSVDGSGVGQGYILNADGTLNSPSNPTAMGSVISIFATGPGPITISGPFAVTQVVPAVFIDGFYADGVDARLGPVDGLPGNVYQLRVIVPDPSRYANVNPNLAGFKMPPQVSVQMLIGDVYSQQGIALSVK